MRFKFFALACLIFAVMNAKANPQDSFAFKIEQVSSSPSYCDSIAYSKEPACFASAPQYCENIAYSKEPACVRYGDENDVDLYCRSFDKLKLCPSVGG